MPAFPEQALDRVWPPSRAPWRLEYEVDFRALLGQTINGTSATIDGKVYTVVNASNALVFDIVNGTGLRIRPTSATEFSVSTKSAPFIGIALTDLVDRYGREDRLFIQVRVASAGLSADHQAYGVMVGSGTEPSDNVKAMLEVVHDATVNVRSTRIWPVSEGYSELAASEPRFLGMEYSPLLVSTWYGSAGQPWPSPRSMTRASYAYLVNNQGPTTVFGYLAPSTDVLRFFAERTITSTQFTAVFQALRVLRQRE